MVRGSVMMGSGPGQGRKGHQPHKRYMNGQMMSPLAVGRSPFSRNLSRYQQAFPATSAVHWHVYWGGAQPGYLLRSAIAELLICAGPVLRAWKRQ
jgi:hypothetical protein